MDPTHPRAPDGPAPRATRGDGPRAAGYWYETADATPVLTAVRGFLRADEAMRRRLRHAMDMNETDLRALRVMAAAELAQRRLSPRDLSRELGISTASTTKLIDRLEAEGRLRREPHPTDRRALRLVLTPDAHREVRETLGAMHGRMRAAADELSPADRDAVVRFLGALATALGGPGVSPGPGPGSGPAPHAASR
ncbi:MarR family winged helix-turn-helix transcriptional regulator [Luteimicrobium subarcticum]|nr:MarR family transcriptional regulator [Luteimicrobium subarcticum]